MNKSTLDDGLAQRVAGLLRESKEPKTELLDKFGFPNVYKTTSRSKRQSIPPSKQIVVFDRDHFIDRYTGERLIFPGALLLLGELYPAAFPKPAPGVGWRVCECHWLYWRLWPTVDHVVPIAQGGAAVDIKNLVTTCQMINSAKAGWMGEAAPPAIRFNLLEESVVAREQWDGLLPWFASTVTKNPALLGRDPVLDSWYRTATRFFQKKQQVPDGDHIWSLKDFD